MLDNELGRMWYKKDNKFNMPKGTHSRNLLFDLLSAA